MLARPKRWLGNCPSTPSNSNSPPSPSPRDVPPAVVEVPSAGGLPYVAIADGGVPPLGSEGKAEWIGWAGRSSRVVPLPSPSKDFALVTSLACSQEGRRAKRPPSPSVHTNCPSKVMPSTSSFPRNAIRLPHNQLPLPTVNLHPSIAQCIGLLRRTYTLLGRNVYVSRVKRIRFAPEG